MPNASELPVQWSWLRAFLSWAVRRDLRSRFQQVWIAGAEHLRRDPQRSVLVAARHRGYWDGPLALLLADTFVSQASYVLMRQDQLDRRPFFGPAGALGVDLQNRRRSAEAMRRCIALLGQTRPACLWIFPEGEEVPGPGPGPLQPGAQAIAKRSKARVVTLSCAYVHRSHPRPEIVIFIQDGSAGIQRALEEGEATTSAFDPSLAWEALWPEREVSSPSPTLPERALAAFCRPFLRSGRGSQALPQAQLVLADPPVGAQTQPTPSPPNPPREKSAGT